jgi:competence protein ComEC
MRHHHGGIKASGRWSWPLALSAGVLIVPLLPRLPGTWVLPVLLAMAAFASWREWPRVLPLFLLALVWALYAYGSAIEDRLEMERAGQTVTVTGTVVSLPETLGDRLRFRFRPDPAGAGEDLPGLMLVSWYRDWPDIHTGQRWRLTMRLKPPWGDVNFLGPDRERWLFSEGIGALGTVRRGEPAFSPGWSDSSIQGLRGAVKMAIGHALDDTRKYAVVLALATADRSGLSRDDRAVLRATGTAHLLAISGLHIGLAALGGSLVSRGFLALLPLRGAGRSPHLLSLLAGVSVAASYALLANLGVSTVRAFLMVVAVAVAMAMARSVHPVRSLSLAMAFVLLADPLAPLGSGFWFSFAAVFALLFAFQSRPGRMPWWTTLIMAQAVIFVFLLPVGSAWLGGISMTGFIANLVAIPWVSLLVVPPVLAGIALLPLYEPLASLSWTLAGHFSAYLLLALDALARLQPQLSGVTAVGTPGYLLASAGGCLLLLPRASRMWPPGLFLLAPLFLPGQPGPGQGELQLDVLDVGQGTAVVLRSQSHALLYDTGPGDNAGADRVDSSIAPLFAAPGAGRPERVVLSHGDLDHGGGLHSLRRIFPGIRVLGSTNDEQMQVERCLAGMRWQRDGFEFRTLHPTAGLPYLRNNSSCVLSVRGDRSSILLSGDIEHSIENRLLLNSLGSHDILLVPHHGSASSSSEAFIEQVNPALAVAPAGLGNRFGFPRTEVRQRYLSRGIAFLTTAECGGLRIRIAANGTISAVSARRHRQRIWRWPAASDCP